MPETASENAVVLDLGVASLARRRAWRMFKDLMAKHGVAVGGIGVIIAILLIFFYLIYVVMPLFVPASINSVSHYSVPSTVKSTAQSTVQTPDTIPADAAPSETSSTDSTSSNSVAPISAASPDSESAVYLTLDEQGEIAARFFHSGNIVFFESKNGETLQSQQLPVPEGISISSFAVGNPARGVFAYGLSNGKAIVSKLSYKVTYPNDVRVITPVLSFPFGEAPIVVDEEGGSISHLAIQDTDEGLTLIAATDDKRIVVASFTKEESLLGDEVSLESTYSAIDDYDSEVSYLLLSQNQANLYIANSAGQLSHYDVRDKESIKLIQKLSIIKPNRQLTQLVFLTGDLSLMAGDSKGTVTQWFAVRNERNDEVLTPIRSFQLGTNPITAISSEQRRKGFVAANASGMIGIFHTTAERSLLTRQIETASLSLASLSPRANALLLEDSNHLLHFMRIKNEHPEVSWSSLWNKVWYESYDSPQYIWQSSSADNDFEPKLSLTPLVFGTLKAAFYAMLFAIPLAIFGAIYTAYFMAPRMRKIVKPSIETMEALPTVILGFLAGLWLAPLVEENLPGIFSLLLIMPIGVLLFAYAWHVFSAKLRIRIAEGWIAALLIPVVLLLGWFAMSLSHPLEFLLFDGNMRSWLANDLGVDFDQRNSIVVGFAMGFAVIPTIFSIAEDAIFSVPKHLTFGSLALGATLWQTLTRVVILTASPGIFSAVMIGLGRAVGETMIVLMATGNTPVMDFSMFQGMRTLAANIAVEMPESELHSTHYRVLFLAALVLFLFTFVFNTFAELVRQRLRVKYSSL